MPWCLDNHSGRSIPVGPYGFLVFHTAIPVPPVTMGIPVVPSTGTRPGIWFWPHNSHRVHVYVHTYSEYVATGTDLDIFRVATHSSSELPQNYSSY